MVTLDVFERLDDSLELFSCFIFGFRLDEHREVGDGAVRDEFLLVEIGVDPCPDPVKKMLAFIDGVAEDEVSVAHENQTYDRVVDSGFSFAEDLLALDNEPEPVPVAGDIVLEDEVAHLLVALMRPYDVRDKNDENEKRDKICS